MLYGPNHKSRCTSRRKCRTRGASRHARSGLQRESTSNIKASRHIADFLLLAITRMQDHIGWFMDEFRRKLQIDWIRYFISLFRFVLVKTMDIHFLLRAKVKQCLSISFNAPKQLQNFQGSRKNKYSYLVISNRNIQHFSPFIVSPFIVYNIALILCALRARFCTSGRI